MKTAFITGASSGIGKACAQSLARVGWRVLAGVRSLADAPSADGVVPVLLDVTNAQHIRDAEQRVASVTGSAGLDALVNNAGIAVGGPVEALPIDQLRKQLEVNVIGLVAVTQALLPHLRAARGRIVNISSVSGRLASPCMAPYSASKFAVEAISDSLRGEVADQGISVVVIQPGPIATAIWEKAREDHSRRATGVPEPLRRLYGPLVDGILARVREASADAIPAEQVARLVVRCLTVPRPRTRYRIGPGSFVAARLLPLLPDRWRDALLRRALLRRSS